MPINGKQKQPNLTVIPKPQVDTSTLNSDYSNLASNNPYENMQYTQSFWDKVRGFFGFRTDAQKFEDEMYNNAQLYNAQLLQAQREEEYNSASAQAQRMREAGINPDLQSGSISAGDATEFDNQSTEAPETPNTDREFVAKANSTIGGLVEGVMGIATQVMAIANDASGLIGKFFDLEQKNVSSFDALGDWAKTFLRQNIFGDSTRFRPKYDPDTGEMIGYEDSGFDNFDIRQQIDSVFSQWSNFNEFDKDSEIRTRFPSRTERRRAWYELRRISKDPQFLNELYGTINSLNSERTTLNKNRNSKFYSSSDNTMMQALAPLVQLSDKLVELQYKISVDSTQIQDDYWSNVQHKNLSHEEIQHSDGSVTTVDEIQPSLGEAKARHDLAGVASETQGIYYNHVINQIFFDTAQKIQNKIEAAQRRGDTATLYQLEIMLLNSLRSTNLIELGADFLKPRSQEETQTINKTTTKEKLK